MTTLTVRETGEIVERVETQKVAGRIIYTVRHGDGRVHNYTWETVRRTLPSD